MATEKVTVSQTFERADETSIEILWKATKPADYVWYSIDNGKTWNAVGETNKTNGFYVITGLSPNTSYKIKTRIHNVQSGIGFNFSSSTLTAQTYNYPYCIEAPDFTIGETVTLKFYNPLNRTFKWDILGTDNSRIGGKSSQTGTSYKGINGSTSIENLYNSIPNSQFGTYKVVVTYGKSVITYDKGNKYHIDTTKCLPIFNADIRYEDTNPKTQAVSNFIVKDYSILMAGVVIGDEAVAVNGSSITHYVFTIDNISQTVPHIVGNVITTLGVITSAGARRLTVTAYDSRGLYSSVYKDITIYDYYKPVVNADIKRLNNFESQTTIKISGSYTPLKLGNTNKNYVSQVFYRYRETNGTWSSWIEVTVYGQGTNEYYCSDVLLSLNNSKSFEFEFNAIDKLDTGTAEGTVGIGQAIFFISSNQKACFINGQKIIMYDVVETWEGW